MGNKPKWNEALSEAMRGQIGTTREVFTNSNGSNVILERAGDKWRRDHSEGSPDVDAEEEEEPEDDEGEENEEGEDTGNNPGGPSSGPANGGTGPGPDYDGGTRPGPTGVNPPRDGPKWVDIGIKPGPKTQQKKVFGGKTNAKNEKIKHVYEEMKARLDQQLEHYYRTGKFTIDPTQMMNKVFHNIMGKYGYKSIFNNWFKNVAERHSWVKKAWETYQQISPKQLAKKLKGKLTLNNISKLLKMKPGTVNKLNQAFNLVKILKQIKSAPINFIINAFTKTGGLSTQMGTLVNALGGADASDLLSYVITLLIT